MGSTPEPKLSPEEWDARINKRNGGILCCDYGVCTNWRGVQPREQIEPNNQFRQYDNGGIVGRRVIDNHHPKCGAEYDVDDGCQRHGLQRWGGHSP